MTYEEFKADVYKHLETDKPKYCSKGQFVFDYVDSTYGVAREVQFNDDIDCYYNNDKIEDFLIASYNRIKEMKTIETTLQLLEQLCKLPKEDIEYAITLLLTQGKLDFVTINSAYVKYLELKNEDHKLKLADANTCTMSLLSQVTQKKNSQNYSAIHWALHNLNESKQFQMQRLNEKFGYNPDKDCEFSFYWRDTHKEKR